MSTNALLVLLRRAIQTETSAHYAAGVSTALTVAYNAAGIALVGGAGDEEAVPDAETLLQWLQGDVTTIAGGATSVTWYLAWDANGGNAITGEITTPITLESGSAVLGTVIASIRSGGFPYMRPAGIGVAATIHLFAKTDAGTLTLAGSRLFFTAATATSPS